MENATAMCNTQGQFLLYLSYFICKNQLVTQYIGFMTPKRS